MKFWTVDHILSLFNFVHVKYGSDQAWGYDLNERPKITTRIQRSSHDNYRYKDQCIYICIDGLLDW